MFTARALLAPLKEQLLAGLALRYVAYPDELVLREPCHFPHYVPDARPKVPFIVRWFVPHTLSIHLRFMNCKGSYPLPFFFLCVVSVIPTLGVLRIDAPRLQSGDASGHSAHLAGKAKCDQHKRAVLPLITPSPSFSPL